MTNYHLLVANLKKYEGNTFKDLLEEENIDGKAGIIWHISSENRKRVHQIKNGDICYIYYANLPDGSSRILFKGKVLESDYDKKDNEPLIWDNDKGILGARLKLTSISLENNEKFSRDNLKKKYDINNFQSYSRIQCEINPKHKKLVEDIENDPSSNSRLKTVYDYFNNNYCLCELKEGNDKKHSTFIEENGFYYIEEHHLVERNLIKKYKDKTKDIDNMINDKKNLFKLCPNCHREIHYGRLEERRRKIEKLYNQRKDFFDSNFNDLKEGKDTLTWLYEMYNCNL